MRLQVISLLSLLSLGVPRIQAYPRGSTDGEVFAETIPPKEVYTFQISTPVPNDISEQGIGPLLSRPSKSRRRSDRSKRGGFWLRHEKEKGDEMFMPFLGLLQKRDGRGEAITVSVYETTTDMPSSVGTLTQKCMTLVDDPSQTFCETLLDGESIGSDSGLGAMPVESPSVSSSDSPSATSSTVAVATVQATLTTSSSTLLTSSVSVAEFSETTTSSASSALTSSITDAGSSVSPTTSSTLSSPQPTSTAPQPILGATIQPVLPSSTISILGSSATSSPQVAISSVKVDATVNAVSPASVSILIDGTYTTTATAAQDNSSASSTPAPMPGQKLQVLPIGLGIFGGLAGLTLLIVGYVMYERRKYKKQFIRRKAIEQGSLAEKGAPMSGGYGSA